MVKATQSVIDENDASSLHVWFDEVLQMRFAEVLSFRESALDQTKTEGVHDMRVAIRRLRSLLCDLGKITDKFPLKTLVKNLREIAAALGKVRDLDVFIAVLKKAGKKSADTAVNEVLTNLIAELHEQRNLAYRELVTTLSEERMAYLEHQFHEALERSNRHRKDFDELTPAEAGAKIISRCLDRFLDLSECIYYPFAVKRLHRFRIAGKHLRYALELFSGMLHEDIARFAEDARKMQSYLGEIHDCDVWISRLRTALVKPQKNAPPDPFDSAAAAWLLAYLLRRRTKAYRSALLLWRKWDLEKLRTFEFYTSKKSVPQY